MCPWRAPAVDLDRLAEPDRRYQRRGEDQHAEAGVTHRRERDAWPERHRAPAVAASHASGAVTAAQSSASGSMAARKPNPRMVSRGHAVAANVATAPSARPRPSDDPRLIERTTTANSSARGERQQQHEGRHLAGRDDRPAEADQEPGRAEHGGAGRSGDRVEDDGERDRHHHGERGGDQDAPETHAQRHEHEQERDASTSGSVRTSGNATAPTICAAITVTGVATARAASRPRPRGRLGGTGRRRAGRGEAADSAGFVA